MNIDLEHLREWIGRREERTDEVAPAPIAALSATLDREDPAPAPGDAVPPLWHWLYFTPLARWSDIGPDGHAKRGAFLPPVGLPRRMWAGGRLEFHRPMRIGEAIKRRSIIAGVDAKAGRNGPLVFVTVRHDISDARGVLITEEHDIVYRDHPPARGVADGRGEAPTHQALVEAAFSRDIVPDPVLLFRYSALTFNGHRIHYDLSYATEVEGYPGLVVHGPLLATLLLDLLRREHPEADVHRFAFRARSPLFDIHPFRVCGRPSPDRGFALWAQGHDGALAIEATVNA